MRTSVDFTRIFLSGDWRGLREAGRVVLASDACLPVLYLYFYVVFDQAPRFLDFYRKQVTCDPLAHDVWTSFIPIPAYLGDPSGSLVLAAEAVSVAGTSSSLETEAVLGKVAIGDLDGARTALRSPALSERDAAELTALVLAAEGRAGEARQAASAALDGANDRLAKCGADAALVTLCTECLSPAQRARPGDAQEIAERVGDRDGANAAASRIDTHLLGSAVLVRVTDWCRCASPFDLEATPNFARQVAEAGLDWPPPAIIRLPGKDW